MPDASRPPHFIEQIVEADSAGTKWGTTSEGVPRVHTRFPPEPNGYLHIGHAKSICLNFGLAQKYAGKFNLRFDDTNPSKEEQEYVDGIMADVRWLGADWEGPHGGGMYWASDYFEKMYEYGEELIRKGRAYVCDMTAEEVGKTRGTPTAAGQESPFRNRGVEENLELLRRMRGGEFPNGSKTLRAKIDMGSPNFNLRDPVLYRILHEEHHNTGKEWCIYPMYDWAHGFEDSLEGITHSICTLEFENHRPLYDWFIRSVNEGRTGDGSGAWGRLIHHPQQLEFARLNLTYTLMSKRKLLDLVAGGRVKGWDHPRMPTLSGLRRRGYTPEAIRDFCDEIGVTKQESVIDVTRLENSVRDHLNKTAPRAMCVLRPLKVVIDNWPAGKVDELEFVINPEAYERAKEAGQAAAGATRRIAFTGTLYIEREDFMEVPPKKFFRLSPGTEVRLRWAYFVKCVGLEKDAAGNVTCVHCTYDPATRGGDAPPGPNGEPPRKVKATIHWISAARAVDAEVRLFDRLFNAEEPGKRTGNYLDDLNPASLEVITSAKIDPYLAEAARFRPRAVRSGEHTLRLGEGDRFQFERLGYFAVDPDSGARFGGSGAPGSGDKLVFNRTVTLKDTWAKEAQKA